MIEIPNINPPKKQGYANFLKDNATDAKIVNEEKKKELRDKEELRDDKKFRVPEYISVFKADMAAKEEKIKSEEKKVELKKEDVKDSGEENKGIKKFLKKFDSDLSKNVGKIAIGAGIGGGVMAGRKKAENNTVNIKNSISGGNDGPDASTLKMFFILALAIHFFDAATGFQRPFGIVLYLYIALIIIAFFTLFKMHVAVDEMAMIFATGASYALPFVVDYLTGSLFEIVAGTLFLLPVLPIYLALKFPEHTFIRTAITWYLIAWTIFLTFWLMTVFSAGQDTKALIKHPLAGVKHVWIGIKSTFQKVGATFTTTIQRAIAQATGEPYDGQEESKVGIYVENVKPLETRYTTLSDVFVEAKIRGINVKEGVSVGTICYIDGIGEGKTKPSKIYVSEGNYENYVDCELGKLPAGTYTVKVKAMFEFEGSADISYTFVNSDIRAEQYERLGIDPRTMATYSGGPVALGLPALEQPLRVSTDEDNADLYSYRYGISLQNKWSQGKVTKGIRYLLDTPEEISLIDCSRDFESEGIDSVTGRNRYTFIMDSANALESFDAVTCRMKIDDVNSLLSSDKNVRTFAGRARYEYAIEGSTVVTIEKS